MYTCIYVYTYIYTYIIFSCPSAPRGPSPAVLLAVRIHRLAPTPNFGSCSFSEN